MLIHDIYYVSRALFYLTRDYIIEEYLIKPKLKEKINLAHLQI